MTGMKQMVTVLGIKRFVGQIDGKDINSLKCDVYSKEEYKPEETRLGRPVVTYKIEDTTVYDAFTGIVFPCECEATLRIAGERVVFTALSPLHTLEIKEITIPEPIADNEQVTKKTK